jgi:hypothetical protein
VVAVVGLVLVAPGRGAPAVAELPVRPTESHIDGSLDGVAVTSAEYDDLAAAYETALTGREDAQRRAEQLRADEAAQAEIVAAAEAGVTVARQEVVAARAALSSMAVAAYVGIEGAEPAAIAVAIAEGSVHLDDSRVVVAEIIGEDRVARVEVARAGLEEARTVLDDAEERMAAILAARAEVEAERDRYLEAELNLGPDVVDARARARVRGHDLTLVALDAYTAAARATTGSDPACGVGWELLAGIGRVESRHGTFAGTRLDAAGLTEDRIIGIALTGTGGTALIGDTDGGTLDADTTYDRAVGPMQFIPSTWARWARDGDGDGVADPHDIYDAAMTAAAYLCASGPGLDTEAGRARAVLSYNHSQAYVTSVTGFADGYRSLVL